MRALSKAITLIPFQVDEFLADIYLSVNTCSVPQHLQEVPSLLTRRKAGSDNFRFEDAEIREDMRDNCEEVARFSGRLDRK